MTDYYVVTGNVFTNMDSFVADGTTCAVEAQPDNGAYASEYCETGATLYSGNGCHVTCDDGYAASGVTRCVEGAFVERRAADADAAGAPEPRAVVRAVGGAVGAADFFYKKSKYDCDYVAKKSSRCKSKNTDEGDVSSVDACPVACGACDSEAACADSTSWYWKKSKYDCDYIAKKSKRCKSKYADEYDVSSSKYDCDYIAKKSQRCKSKYTDEADVSSSDACPVAC
ncbi:DNA binding protein [Aureococcus anophagefferens]|nr:DNA binding protein [Aureococcus anophagefferens]